MSVARTTTVDFDLEILKEAARQLGFIATNNKDVRGWAGGTIAKNAELVITSRNHQFDMGFVRQPDGSIKMRADHHGGHVDRDLKAIVPRYIEVMAERNSHGRFRNPVREETKNEIVLRYKF